VRLPADQLLINYRHGKYTDHRLGEKTRQRAEKGMEKPDKTYGILKDGTVLTDESAELLVDSAFDALANGEGRLKKSPTNQLRIRTSVTELPLELQEAALYK
jgi:hypothetical protein